MERLKPEKIKSIKVRGIVTEVYKDKWFKFKIIPKNKNLKEELKKLKIIEQKVENGDYKYFREVFNGVGIFLSYLNLESLKGMYKDPKNNLPYEIWTEGGDLVYRHSIIERKEEIFNKLEKIAIEEGLR